MKQALKIVALFVGAYALTVGLAFVLVLVGAEINMQQRFRHAGPLMITFMILTGIEFLVSAVLVMLGLRRLTGNVGARIAVTASYVLVLIPTFATFLLTLLLGFDH
jgi:hypothetical protein